MLNFTYLNQKFGKIGKAFNMLDDYYAARGWDKNGIPTRAKLEELELKDIADDLNLG